MDSHKALSFDLNLIGDAQSSHEIRPSLSSEWARCLASKEGRKGPFQERVLSFVRTDIRGLYTHTHTHVCMIQQTKKLTYSHRNKEMKEQIKMEATSCDLDSTASKATLKRSKMMRTNL